MSERAASKTTVLCAVFSYPTWTATQSIYLTDSAAPLQVSYGGAVRTFEPDRYLAYESVERTGTMEEDAGTLTTSALWGFAARSLRGDTIEELTVHVFELVIEAVNDAGPSTVSLLAWDRGLAVAVTNAEGEDVGACSWTIQNTKAASNKTLNTRATENCPARLGDGKVCLFDLEAARDSVTIVSTIGFEITVQGLRAESDEYWTHGYVQIEGLELKIRKVEGSTITLYTPLPEDLRIALGSGSTIVARVYPGCSGSLTECAMFGQTSRFWGIGLSIEARNPLFQLPL